MPPRLFLRQGVTDHTIGDNVFAMPESPFTDAAYYLKLVRILKGRSTQDIANARKLRNFLPLLDEAHRNWLIGKLDESEEMVVQLVRFHGTSL